MNINIYEGDIVTLLCGLSLTGFAYDRDREVFVASIYNMPNHNITYNDKGIVINYKTKEPVENLKSYNLTIDNISEVTHNKSDYVVYTENFEPYVNKGLKCEKQRYYITVGLPSDEHVVAKDLDINHVSLGANGFNIGAKFIIKDDLLHEGYFYCDVSPYNKPKIVEFANGKPNLLPKEKLNRVLMAVPKYEPITFAMDVIRFLASPATQQSVVCMEYLKSAYVALGGGKL